jgi:hypothetical protein
MRILSIAAMSRIGTAVSPTLVQLIERSKSYVKERLQRAPNVVASGPFKKSS